MFGLIRDIQTHFFNACNIWSIFEFNVGKSRKIEFAEEWIAIKYPILYSPLKDILPEWKNPKLINGHIFVRDLKVTTRRYDKDMEAMCLKIS